MKEWQSTQKKHLNVLLSKEELSFLIAIHEDATEELDPIEYTTIAGIDFSDSETFLEDLKQAAFLLSGVS